MSAIAAIVVGPHDDWRSFGAGVEPAAVARVESLAGVRDAARGLDAPLVWVVDSGAMPSEGALGALVESGYLPAVSMPVDEGGEPVEAVLGRLAEADKDTVVEAVSRRCVPLRHTHVVSLLVAREAVVEQPPPDASLGRYAGSEWTARLFAAAPGMLVTTSTVRPRDWRPGSPRDALRMARTGVWWRGETLLELRRSVTAGRAGR
jgi:hypothetical protein